jgi:26S proteasome regulatory subunit N1
MDLLTKLSYDTDTNVSQSAVFALGLIGAGTNNSRIA